MYIIYICTITCICIRIRIIPIHVYGYYLNMFILNISLCPLDKKNLDCKYRNLRFYSPLSPTVLS